MTKSMMGYLAAAILTVVSAGTDAVGAEWTATGHKGIRVTLSEDAGKCGIRGKDAFAKQLEESLGEIGLRVDPRQPLVAQLTVSSKPIESLEGQCVTIITLAFVIPMEMEFIEVTDKITNREAVVSILEKARKFPIVLYEDSDFTASWPTNSHADALYLVDQLAQRYAGPR